MVVWWCQGRICDACWEIHVKCQGSKVGYQKWHKFIVISLMWEHSYKEWINWYSWHWVRCQWRGCCWEQRIWHCYWLNIIRVHHHVSVAVAIGTAVAHILPRVKSDNEVFHVAIRHIVVRILNCSIPCQYSQCSVICVIFLNNTNIDCSLTDIHTTCVDLDLRIGLLDTVSVGHDIVSHCRKRKLNRDHFAVLEIINSCCDGL